MERPEWWAWDLVLTEYLDRRMEERGFTAVDLRGMLADSHVVVGPHRGRWTALTRLNRRPWAVVLEPNTELEAMFVVTAYQRVHIV